MSSDDAQARPHVSDAATEAFHARGDALHAAVVALQRDLVDVVTHSPLDRSQLKTALSRFLDTLREHVEGSEADDGLLAQITETAPWLTPRTRQLRTEHDVLLATAEGLLGRVDGDEDTSTLTSEANDLAEEVTQHRHRATEILLDAYLLDIPPVD